MLFHPDGADIKNVAVRPGERAGNLKILSVKGALGSHCITNKNLGPDVIDKLISKRCIVTGEFKKTRFVTPCQRDQQVVCDLGSRDDAFRVKFQ